MLYELYIIHFTKCIVNKSPYRIKEVRTLISFGKESIQNNSIHYFTYLYSPYFYVSPFLLCSHQLIHISLSINNKIT